MPVDANVRGRGRYVTTCEDVFSERVARGMRNEFASRPGAPHAAGTVVVWANGLFAHQWVLRLMQHVEKLQWSAWILCANNHAHLRPSAEAYTRHVKEYPVGIKLFHTNTDHYKSPPFRTKFPVLLMFFDNRPLSARGAVSFPDVPEWAKP